MESHQKTTVVTSTYTSTTTSTYTTTTTYTTAMKASVPQTANISYPFHHFVKISNIDYAGNNTVEIYFISWYGCLDGATNSWALYMVLSHYGTLNVSPNYSDYKPQPLTPTKKIMGMVPGLIFNSFKPNSTILFNPIYLMGKFYPNKTMTLINGTMLNYTKINLVELELHELKNEAPSWVYNIIYEYEVNMTFEDGKALVWFKAPAPHIPTTTIITGPNGTWMMIGYPEYICYGAPGLLAEYAAHYNYSMGVPMNILNDIKTNNLPSNLDFLELFGMYFQVIIQEAME